MSSPDVHNFRLEVGPESVDHNWADSSTSPGAGMATLYVPSLHAALGAAPSADLTVSVSATSGADGAELSLAAPELLAPTAPVQAGCHSLSGAPAPSFALTATATDMAPKDCVRTCLSYGGQGNRFAYLRGGDTCHCEEELRADLPPAAEDRCKVSTC